MSDRSYIIQHFHLFPLGFILFNLDCQRTKIGQRSEGSLPEVLWGQEIHWGPEAQGDPRDRAGLSQEDEAGCWAGDTASSLG